MSRICQRIYSLLSYAPQRKARECLKDKKGKPLSTLPNSQDSCPPSGSKRKKKSAINITSCNRQDCNQGHLLDMKCPPVRTVPLVIRKHCSSFLIKQSKTHRTLVSEFPCCKYLLRMSELGLGNGSVGKVSTAQGCRPELRSPNPEKKTDMVAFSYNLSAQWEKGSGDYQKLAGQMA